jgi:predicted GIY-YIG superfamily endonuclease
MFERMRTRSAGQGVFVLVLLLTAATSPSPGGEIETGKPPEDRSLREVVRRAFREVHDGWSTDEVLVRDDLNQAFLRECQRQLPHVPAAELNWALLNLRKSGGLGPVVTRQRRDRHDAYQHAAEIAARLLYDKSQLTVDRVICDLSHRKKFDRIANEIAPQVSTYLLRKAALGLRKKRALRPELVLRVADWDRDVRTLSAARILADPRTVPPKPGVYLFRDRTGYLYIGESGNLQSRVNQHLDDSDRLSLARYLREQVTVDELTIELHVFDAHSPARREVVRRAYESELIGSRNPRFNVRP